MNIRGYRDLIVWQGATALVEHVYLTTEGRPEREVSALADWV